MNVLTEVKHFRLDYPEFIANVAKGLSCLHFSLSLPYLSFSLFLLAFISLFFSLYIYMCVYIYISSSLRDLSIYAHIYIYVVG